MLDIKPFIPVGHDNAIDIFDLVGVTNEDSRTVRKAIEIARRNGAVIVNLQDGAGYFTPTPEELALAKKQYSQERSRALKILRANKAIHCWIADVEAGRINNG